MRVAFLPIGYHTSEIVQKELEGLDLDLYEDEDLQLDPDAELELANVFKNFEEDRLRFWN
jgi:hypothetical protein